MASSRECWATTVGPVGICVPNPPDVQAGLCSPAVFSTARDQPVAGMEASQMTAPDDGRNPSALEMTMRGMQRDGRKISRKSTVAGEQRDRVLEPRGTPRKMADRRSCGAPNRQAPRVAHVLFNAVGESPMVAGGV